MQGKKVTPTAVLLAAAALAAPASARADYREVPVANGGKITGKLTFKGALPDKAVETYPVPGKSPRCGTALRKVVTIDVKDGALRGAFVLLEGITQGKKWPERKAPPLLEQKDCVFLPSHQVVRAGSPLLIRNSDEGTLHTVNVREVSQVSSGREVSRMVFNVAQPLPGDLEKNVKPRASPFLTVGCELHNFMVAYLVAPEHPYATVVGSDGSFTLDGVPPGTYTLDAWHPKLGHKKAEVTVAAGQVAQASFEFSP